MLWLEKENQRLLRIVDELQTGPLRRSSQPENSQQLESDQVVCSTSSGTSSKQKTFQRCLQTQQMTDEDASSHQHLHQGAFEEVPIQFIQGPDLQKEAQPEDLTSEFKHFENDPNTLCCFVESQESNITSQDLTHQSTRSSYIIKQSQRLEAKCRALDTVNQHLQSALDNSGTLCSSTKAFFYT